MSAVRPPAVAGSFYPADAGRLRAAVEGYLASANGSHAAATPKR
jgi:AmmeMemoRadiSam system protein B